MARPYTAYPDKNFPIDCLEVLGGFEHQQRVRMLKGYYRNARAGVKPNYSCFPQLSIKVINKTYPFEFIINTMKIDALLLKLTV